MNERNETVEDLRDVLLRNGFVRCDIMACNCGSWHHRYGYPERFREFEQALSDAGHPCCNANGNIALRALGELVAERDSLLKALNSETAEWPECSGDPACCPENEGFGCCKNCLPVGIIETPDDMKHRPEEYM